MAQTQSAIGQDRTAGELQIWTEFDFYTLANSIPQLAWMADAAGYIFWYNQRWYDFTGTTLEEMQGWGWQKVHHPEEVGRVVERIQRAFATGEPWEDTFPLRGKDGEYRWFLSRALPIRDAEGRVVRWFGTNTDVTEERQKEQALRENERRLSMQNARLAELTSDNAHQTEVLRSILDAMSEGVFVADADGRLILINPAAECLLGRPSEPTLAATRQTCEYYRPDMVTPLGVQDLPSARAIRGEEVDNAEIFIRPFHTGKGVWISVNGHPLRDQSGKLRGGVVVFHDITERKRAEVALAAARDAAETATRAKSKFLANMSHEIRTPMNGIMGMTELALDTELTVEQRDYLITVKSSADALLSLLNDILDFSKIEAGRIELDPIEFLLRDSIGDTLSPLAVRASAKGVELAYDVHPDVPDALIGDVYRLRQILVNLAGNAIKFTERGEVVISISQRERLADEVVLEVTVYDTGIGISPEAAARLFVAFEQAETSTTRKYGGTGLGLAISKQLIELMGGQIRLESTPGVGSTFIFNVRFKVGVSRPSGSAEDAVWTLHGKSALIVDDNQTNRRILTAMLARWGLRPLEADSAKAALTALDRANDAGQNVSIVVTDLRMPEIDGFDLTRAIRDHPLFGSLPVILLSSSASTGEQAVCTELGIAARLHKPVKQSLLLDNIMIALDAADRSRSGAVRRDATPEATNARPRPLRILLAEDNAINQKFAVLVLEGAGHTVTVANNGREAIDSTGSQEFDVVLMDVQMPEVDGLDATRAIRVREGGRTRLPIIAMTADAMKGDREMCLEAGMDGYVSKPVKKDMLFAEVERILKELSHGKNF